MCNCWISVIITGMAWSNGVLVGMIYMAPRFLAFFFLLHLSPLSTSILENGHFRRTFPLKVSTVDLPALCLVGFQAFDAQICLRFFFFFFFFLVYGRKRFLADYLKTSQWAGKCQPSTSDLVHEVFPCAARTTANL